MFIAKYQAAAPIPILSKTLPGGQIRMYSRFKGVLWLRTLSYEEVLIWLEEIGALLKPHIWLPDLTRNFAPRTRSHSDMARRSRELALLSLDRYLSDQCMSRYVCSRLTTNPGLLSGCLAVCMIVTVSVVDSMASARIK
jgi:hypothetical protein